MNLSDNNDERFLSYLTGKLTPEEDAAFESRIELDDVLQTQLESFRSKHERAAMAMAMYEQWEEQINKSTKKSSNDQIKHAQRLKLPNNSKPANRLNLWQRYKHIMAPSVAAALLLLVFGVNYLYNGNSDNSKLSVPELAISYHVKTTPDEGRGAAEDAWTSAKGLYKEGAYNEAIDAMETITVRTPEVNYLLAHAYFIIQDYQRSAEIFKTVAQSSNAFSNDAKWNSVLATLAQPDKLAEGERELNNFILSSPNHSRAAELSVKLREK